MFDRCRATKGAQCDYDNSNVCKRCHKPKNDNDDDNEMQQAVPAPYFLQQQSAYPYAMQVAQAPQQHQHVEQYVIAGNTKFCTATMGGDCEYNDQNICKRCKKSKQNDDE